MKKKNIGIFLLILLVGVLGAYIAGTYAKYTGTVAKNGTATIAKWAFNSDNTSGNIDITLTPTPDATTVATDKIAPGTSGSFDIVVSNENSEVGINYEIIFGSLANVPTNLIFKIGGTTVTPATQKITGTLPAGQKETISLVWEWPYETPANSAAGDPADIANGTASGTNLNMSFTATINGTQVPPSTSAITKTYSVVAN